MLDAAQRLFLDRGYATTTMTAIAQRAGVSVETIYKTFGGKPALVRAIYERALTGREAVPAYQRSDEMREHETDPVTIVGEWARLTAEVASTATPIRLLMRAAAASDPDMAALLDQTNRQRLKRMRHHACFLADRGHLREGVTVTEATDVLYTCSSVEFYEVLVLQRRWSLARYARFVADFMISSLLAHRT